MCSVSRRQGFYSRDPGYSSHGNLFLFIRPRIQELISNQQSSLACAFVQVTEICGGLDFNTTFLVIVKLHRLEKGEGWKLIEII